MDNLSLPSFSEKCHPLLRKKTRCHSILRIIINVHSPLCRITEYQTSFPALSEYGISNFIPRFIEIRSIKCHSPVYRNTEYQMSFPDLSDYGKEKTSFPGLPDYGSSLKFSFLKCHSLFVGGRNVKSVIPSVSGPKMSPIKMSVSTNHQFINTFQISQYNYQHGSGQSFSPVKLQYPLAESDPFLQRIWVSLFIQNKSSLSFYIHN